MHNDCDDWGVGVQRKKQPTSRTTRDVCLHATFQEASLQLRPAGLMSRSRVGIDRCKVAARFPARGYALSRLRAQRNGHTRRYTYVKRTANHAYIHPLPDIPRRAPMFLLPTARTARHRLLFAASRVVVRCRRVRHVGRGRLAKRSVACCLGDCADDTRAVTFAVAQQGCFILARIPGKGQDMLSSCYNFICIRC